MVERLSGVRIPLPPQLDNTIKIPHTKIAMLSARKVFLSFCLFLVTFLAAPSLSFAQLPTSNLNPEVPRNQHTLAQSTMIEIMSAVICQMTGIDPLYPEQGCLGFNTETKKLGLIPPEYDDNGKLQAGGMLGGTSDMIAALYTPITSTTEFVHYMTRDFGIVKDANAQAGYGFQALSPVLAVWEVVRNAAYTLLVLAFVFIGIGIMLRVKIDPRTVMGIQNQIPRVIIAILLITFSYAISAVLIDMMWVTTYAGVNLLTNAQGESIKVDSCKSTNNKVGIAEQVNKNILQTPMTFFHQVFAECDDSEQEGVLQGRGYLQGNNRDGGFHVMTKAIGGATGQLINNTVRSIFLDEDDESRDCGLLSTLGNPIQCVKKGLINGLGFFASLLTTIIIFTVLLTTLFRIWFMLLKAFAYTLIYTITGPIYIAFGLLPSKPLGFEKWLRSIFANLAVFPLTAFLLVGARLMVGLYENASTTAFTPPLLGNTANTNYGVLIALGILLLGPAIGDILRDKMGAQNLKTPGIVKTGLILGAAPVGQLANRIKANATRRDNAGNPIGSFSAGVERSTSAAKQSLGKIPIIKSLGGEKYAINEAEKRTNRQRYGMAATNKQILKNNEHFGLEKVKGKAKLKNGNTVQSASDYRKWVGEMSTDDRKKHIQDVMGGRRLGAHGWYGDEHASRTGGERGSEGSSNQNSSTNINTPHVTIRAGSIEGLHERMDEKLRNSTPEARERFQNNYHAKTANKFINKDQSSYSTEEREEAKRVLEEILSEENGDGNNSA